MREVSKAEFFAFIGPQNVHPRPEADATYWETPARNLVGVSRPGWKNPGDAKSYSIAKATGA